MPIPQAQLAQAFAYLNSLGQETGANLQLGTILFDLISSHNDLVADHAALLGAFNTLEAKYVALCGHLDTADVAGIGNANQATYGSGAGVAAAPAETATAAPTIGSL